MRFTKTFPFVSTAPAAPSAAYLASHPSPPRTSHYRTHSHSNSISNPLRQERDLESANTSPTMPSSNLAHATVPRFTSPRAAPSPPSHMKSLSTQSHARTDSTDDHQSFTPWQPLPTEKFRREEVDEEFARQKKRRRIRLIIIGVVSAIILIVAILLIVRLVRPAKGEESAPAAPTNASQLSEEQRKCVDDFGAIATSDPAAYDCASCLPALRTVQLDFFGDGRPLADTVNPVTQFCGLRALFDAAGDDARNTLSTSGWMKDARTCAWGGVSCDGVGRINTIDLQGGSVPTTIPDEIAVFTGLTRLKIVGNGSIPQGPFPATLPWNLDSLELSQTALEGPLDPAFFDVGGRLCRLTVLILQGNSRLGATLPSTMTRIPFQQITVTGQGLSMPLDTLLSPNSNFTETLVALNMSNNNLSGSFPVVTLPTKLQRLDLSNNRLTALPEGIVYPADTLQSVDFSDNPQLGGTIDSAICSSSVIRTCSFDGTLFSGVDGVSCGICEF